MRIEFVIDVPGVSNPDAIDAVTVANEAVRIVRNDTGDITASLIHVAVGSDIGVPRDYDPAHPVVSVEATDIVHDPSAPSPYASEPIDHATTPYVVGEPTAPDTRLSVEDAWNEAHAPAAPAVEAAPAEPVATPDAVTPSENHEADAALQLIAPPEPHVETPEEQAYDANGTKD